AGIRQGADVSTFGKLIQLRQFPREMAVDEDQFNSGFVTKAVLPGDLLRSRGNGSQAQGKLRAGDGGGVGEAPRFFLAAGESNLLEMLDPGTPQFIKPRY